MKQRLVATAFTISSILAFAMDNGVLESLPGGNAFRSRFYLPLPAFSVFFLLMIKFLKKDALDNKVTLFIKRTFTAFVWTYWATLFGYAGEELRRRSDIYQKYVSVI